MKKSDLNIELTNWKFSYISKLSEIFNDENMLYNSEDYLPNLYEKAHAENWVHRIITKSKNAKHFAILKDQQLAGGINISLKQNMWKLNAEITYFVAKEFRNKGVVTEAIRQTSSFIFNTYSQIIRIIALTNEDNIAAKKPLLKNGFTLEATLSNFLFQNDKLKNCCVYALKKPSTILT